MDNEIKLGTMQPIPPREVWGNEATDFTPWLAAKDNIRLLGKALEINIEVIAQERPVGPFRADIFAKEVNTGKNIVIENQLEESDHNHLGQIITYASGLETGIIIWIAPKFTKEHRAAIDWLNETTNEQTNFFAVEIEVWKIGNSMPAPKFNIVSQPNDWTDSIQEEIRVLQYTLEKKFYYNYWTGLKELAESTGSAIRCSKPAPQTQMDLLMGNSPFKISAIIEPDKKIVKVVLWVSVKSAGSNRNALFSLLQEKFGSKLLELFGKDLIWNLQPLKRWDEMYVKATFDPKDQINWKQQHVWLKENLEKMFAFFVANLKDVQVDESNTGEQISP